MLSAEEIIKLYKLQPLDLEGGYFRQIWSSTVKMDNSQLSRNYLKEGQRTSGTLIYYLITKDTFSALHRLPTQEHWMYHLGDTCEQLHLKEDGSSNIVRLGSDLLSGETPYICTPENSWQGTRLISGGTFGYMFCSCVMIPGFQWTDFELGERSDLQRLYPDRAEIIKRLTRS